MADAQRQSSVDPSLALGAWLEPLLPGRRTALLGDSSGPLAERLGRASGRRVHAYDPDAARVAASLAQRTGEREAAVVCAPFDEARDAHEGAFDAVVLPDLSAFEDGAEVVALARGLLSARGLLLVASPNPEVAPTARALGYYELYDLLSGTLEHVIMLGQAPFSGFTIADFSAAEDAGVTIDTSLTERSEEPLSFVALASERAIDVDPYVLVQVHAPAGRADSSAAMRDELERLRAEGQALRGQAAENAELRKQRDDNTRLAEERRRMATAASTRAAELEARCDQLEAAAKRARQMEERTVELGQRLERAEVELRREREARARDKERIEEELQEELDRMLERIADLEEALESEAAVTLPVEPPPPPAADAQAVRGYEFQLAELKKTLAEVRMERSDLAKQAARAAALERELAALRERDDEATRGPAANDGELSRLHEVEVDRLEGSLRDRAARLEALRRELLESERIGKELVRELLELRETRARHDNGEHGVEPGGDLDALAQKCSRYEADLQAANWKIAALSSELDQRLEPLGDHAALEDALRQARAEIAELRRQLGPAPAEP
jgi:hypothetical protein